MAITMPRRRLSVLCARGGPIRYCKCNAEAVETELFAAAVRV
jgi:hypothetical protein